MVGPGLQVWTPQPWPTCIVTQTTGTRSGTATEAFGVGTCRDLPRMLNFCTFRVPCLREINPKGTSLYSPILEVYIIFSTF